VDEELPIRREVMARKRSHSFAGYATRRQQELQQELFQAIEKASLGCRSTEATSELEILSDIGSSQEPSMTEGRPKKESSLELDEGDAVPVTTVMLRNLPPAITQQRLIQELNTEGFAGQYDFCYVPREFSTGVGVSFAFVNFRCPEMASRLTEDWRGSRRFCQAFEAPLNISAAKIQGLEGNLAKWNTARLRRVRNRQMRPFVAAALQ